MASVEIASQPAGADVLADGKLVGKTPAKLELPISDLPISLELRLAGYRHKTRDLVVSGNVMLQIPLERAPVEAPHPHPHHPHHSGAGDTGLMSPDDL